MSQNNETKRLSLKELVNTNLNNYLETDWDEPETKELNLQELRQSLEDFFERAGDANDLNSGILKCIEIIKKEFALNMETFSKDRACNALLCFAKYAENLYEQPWREDFKRISITSGGFYHNIYTVFSEEGLTSLLKILRFSNEKNPNFFEYTKNSVSGKSLRACVLKFHAAYLKCRQMNFEVLVQEIHEDEKMDVDVENVDHVDNDNDEDFVKKMADETNTNWLPQILYTAFRRKKPSLATKKEDDKLPEFMSKTPEPEPQVIRKGYWEYRKPAFMSKSPEPVLHLNCRGYWEDDKLPAAMSKSPEQEPQVKSQGFWKTDQYSPGNEYPPLGIVGENVQKFSLHSDGNFPRVDRRHTTGNSNNENNDTNPQLGTKACPACTFHNDLNSDECVMCETDLKGNVYAEVTPTNGKPKALRRSSSKSSDPSPKNKGPPKHN